MLHKTRGIIFRFTKFGDTSIIVNIFTEHFGLKGFMVNGVRSKSAQSKIALYQPLTLVDMVIYHREHANLDRIKEIKCIHPFHTITTDMKKSGIAIFMTEVMNKSVKEESANSELFDFLFQSILALDTMPVGYENFHLHFLIRLSRHLGFGAFRTNEVVSGRPVEATTQSLLQELLQADYLQKVSITNDQRRELLELLLKFYASHADNFGEIKSVQILKEVLG